MKRLAKGSHASTRFAVVCFVVLLGIAVTAPMAFAAKKVDSSIGSLTGATGIEGGVFKTPRGVAVNKTGAGGVGAGELYVVDGENNRVQEFTAAGAFVRAWGMGVNGGPTTTFEVCTVAASCKAGTATATGGGMSAPQGIAIDQATGNVYVTSQSFLRIDVFSATGTFLRSFGQDVVSSGPGNNPAASAKQTVTLSGASGGTFTLSFRGQTTAPIAWNATAANVQSALLALTAVGPGSLSVAGAEGGPYTISFSGGLSNSALPTMGTDDSGLTPGGSTAVAATTVNGSSGAEICVAANSDVCKTGVTGATAGAFAATFSGQLAINPVNSNVVVADPGNRRAQEFTSGGAFIRTFGLDVVNNGPSNGGTTNEVQKVTVAATAGTFTLTFSGQTTSALPWNASPAQVESALNALSTIAGVGGRVSVSGGPGDATGSNPYLVTFGGSQAGTNVAAMTASFAGLGNPVGSQLSCVGAPLRTQWLRNGVLIPGATSANYTAVSADQGTALQCMTTFVNGEGGALGISTTNSAALISPLPGTAMPDNTVVPPTELKSGTLEVGGAGGAVLKCSPGTWTGSPTFAYQWYLNGTALSGNGADTAEYTVQAQDLQGKGNFQCVVLAANAGGATVRSSAARTTTPAPGAASISAALVAPSAIATVTDGVPGAEVCTLAAGDICKTGVAGTTLGGFGGTSPTRVAVDSVGRIYATDTANSRVQRFSAAATGAASFVSTANNISVGGILAIGSGDRVFVSKGASEKEISEYDSSGALLDTHLTGVSAANGIAVNTTSGNLYVSTSGGTQGSRVLVLDNDGALPPPVATVVAVNATEHGATFTGTVNPSGTPGLPTSYHFEYSRNGIAWTPAAADVSLGEGSSTVSVPVGAEGTAAGLEANTVYRVRIVASKAFGAASTTSGEFPFVTDSPAPEVQTHYPQSHTDTTARLLGSINPNNLPTTYRFEFGKTTSYGTLLPSPDASASGGITRLVTEQIEGLQPSTTYHYRLVATNSEGTTKGEDVAFTTSAAGVTATPERAYEMVTPPFKSTRSGGKPGGSVFRNASPGFAGIDGDDFLWYINIFPHSDETAFPFGGDSLRIHRTDDGWVAKTQFTKSPLVGQLLSNNSSGVYSSSRDFGTQAWNFSLELVDNPGTRPANTYTRRDGTGENGYTSWLPNTDAATVPYSLQQVAQDKSLVNDDGSWMLRWGQYRGLLGTTAAEDASVTQLPAATGGRTLYQQENAPLGPLRLVNGCTGSGSDATRIPARIGTGAATDTISGQACEAGAVTNTRGAVAGAGDGGTGVSAGVATTSMSNDGRRVYFTSPDPEATSVPTACAATTEASTSCPPQLFLRQTDSSHANPAVRWISRSRSHAVANNGYDGAMIAGQQVGLFGTGLVFQGASRDGSVVYFKTNAPLTPDDPNGAGVAPPPGGVTTGTANAKSVDLFRYEVPAGGDPGDGVLTRVSGGPNGTADPGITSAMPTRFISDDGSKVYFVSTSPIEGASTAGPLGGVGSPEGVAGNTATANLYLFDATKSGADRYRFIAPLPLNPNGASSCATKGTDSNGELYIMGFSADTNAIKFNPNMKCFRGVPSGNAIAFGSNSRLTADDTDNAYDIYLYDARSNELTRVTAPPAGVAPYGCDEAQTAAHTSSQDCNGDFGFTTYFGNERTRGWRGNQTANMAEDAQGNISVFFESRLSLVPEDKNGNTETNPNRNYWDVYQWKEGKLVVVSPANSEDDAYLSGNAADGLDVFFQTTKRIDPRELDAADMDTYDARVGGGFPYTPPAPPCDVLADECRGAVSPRPQLPAPATGSGVSGGNANEKPPVVTKKCPKGKVRKNGKCVPKPKKSKKTKKSQRTAHANQGRNK